MNEVKAIVLDLDGTLLNSKKEVSKRNQQAIFEMHQKGIFIIFATARPPRSVQLFLPQRLREIGAFVYYNGAFLTDNASGYREHMGIETMIVAEIIEYISETHVDACYSIESEDQCYSNKPFYNETVPNVLTKPTILSLGELKKLKASKFLLSEYPHYQNLKSQFQQKVNAICTDAGTLIQIMAKGVSKEYAVRKLCLHRNILMSNVMAFGDDWNDIELFHVCGIPIAMENAIPELKSAACSITKTNDEDGVAHILEQLI